MGYLEITTRFIIPLVVTFAFMIYFNNIIARPLFSIFKNRDFEASMLVILTALFLVNGLNLSEKYFTIGFFKPVFSSILDSLNVMMSCVLQILPIIAYFFIGCAIMELASVIGHKHGIPAGTHEVKHAEDAPAHENKQ